MFPELKVNLGPISMKEVRQAVKLFKPGKSAGPDDIPIDFWKTVLHHDLVGSDWLLRFVNVVWDGQEVPNDWHRQIVAMIFKKGDAGECGNYRPICPLNSALLSVRNDLVAEVACCRCG